MAYLRLRLTKVFTAPMKSKSSNFYNYSKADDLEHRLTINCNSSWKGQFIYQANRYIHSIFLHLLRMASSYYTSNLSTLTECVDDVTLFNFVLTCSHVSSILTATVCHYTGLKSEHPLVGIQQTSLYANLTFQGWRNSNDIFLETLLSHGPTELCTSLPYLS